MLSSRVDIHRAGGDENRSQAAQRERLDGGLVPEPTHVSGGRRMLLKFPTIFYFDYTFLAATLLGCRLCHLTCVILTLYGFLFTGLAVLKILAPMLSVNFFISA